MLLVQEARARVILKEVATIGTLTLIPTSFIIYTDPADLVSQVLLDIATDWVEYQRNPNLPLFFNDVARDYES